MCVCAVSPGKSCRPLLPIPPHFFALAQRNGVEPQRNALMGAATGAVGSRPPLPRTRSPNITADCVKLTLPGQFTHRVQINLTHQFVPLGLTPKWERRAGPPSSCGGFKGAFLWRLDTVSLGKHQRNGVESQGRLTKTSQRNGAHVESPRPPPAPAPSRAKMSKDNRGSSAHANGGAARVKKALFFGGSTPFLWASTKEMGSNRRAS